MTNFIIIANSLRSSNNDKNDAGYPDFIQCNYFYKYISKNVGYQTLNTFYLYPSLLQMIPLSYIIHSLNDKYYIKNRDSKHYVNSFDGGIILFLIAEFIILTVIYPEFRYINAEKSKDFDFKNYQFLHLGKSFMVSWNETNNDWKDDGKFQVINMNGENTHLIGFNIFLTSILLSLIVYPILHIINNGFNATNGLLLFAHIFFCGIFSTPIYLIEGIGIGWNNIVFAGLWALFFILAFTVSNSEGEKESTEKVGEFYGKMFDTYGINMSLIIILLTLTQYAYITFYKENQNIIMLHIIIITLTIILYMHFGNKKNNDMKQLTVAGGILVLLIYELFVNKHSWDKDRYNIRVVQDKANYAMEEAKMHTKRCKKYDGGGGC